MAHSEETKRNISKGLRSSLKAAAAIEARRGKQQGPMSEEHRTKCAIATSKRMESEAERLLKEALRRMGERVVDHFGVRGYAVDIFLPDRGGAVVECDGEYWHSARNNRHKPDREQRRETVIRSTGYKLIRVSSEEVARDPDEIARRILKEIL